MLISSNDGFNLIVTVQGHKDSYIGEELMGIEEVEMALSVYEPVLYIKESQYPNVILVELSMEPEEAVAILKEAPTTVISKVLPIDEVVKTQKDAILDKSLEIAKKKIKADESFTVRADLRGRRYIESEEELIQMVTDNLIEGLNLDPQSLDPKNPDWIVQVEVVGDDTGISVLKPYQMLKKK